MSDAAGEDRSRLLRALALSSRFHLYLVRVESPRAADQFVDGLADELRQLGREEVRLVRLDPYEGRATAAPIEDGEFLRTGKQRLPRLTAQVLRANALMRWSLGQLDRAARLDEALELVTPLVTARSRALRLTERGRVTEARDVVRRLPTVNPSVFVSEADIEALLGLLDVASRDLERADQSPGSEHRAFLAFVEIARGNNDRAAHLLSRRPFVLPTPPEPEDDRTSALHAYASGILSTVNGDRPRARTSFESAHRHIAEWGRHGFDRRSRLRAKAMVDLCLIQLHPDADQALAMARALAADTVALLGDTGEDCFARAIAVLAHDELARRLAAAAHGDAPEAARRALALAEPLRALDVPGWTAVLGAAERRHAEIAGAK